MFFVGCMKRQPREEERSFVFCVAREWNGELRGACRCVGRGGARWRSERVDDQRANGAASRVVCLLVSSLLSGGLLSGSSGLQIELGEEDTHETDDHVSDHRWSQSPMLACEAVPSASVRRHKDRQSGERNRQQQQERLRSALTPVALSACDCASYLDLVRPNRVIAIPLVVVLDAASLVAPLPRLPRETGSQTQTDAGTELTQDELLILESERTKHTTVAAARIRSSREREA